MKTATLKKPGVSRASAPQKAPEPPAFLRHSAPAIGELWPDQGGRLVAVIWGRDAKPAYGIILPTHKSAILRGTWGSTDNIVEGAQDEWDGPANTLAMAATGSKIASKALALKIDRHNDFYIMARRESLIVAAYADEHFGEGLHWTSTQDRGWRNRAWAQGFGDGSQDYCGKGGEFAVRPVRRAIL